MSTTIRSTSVSQPKVVIVGPLTVAWANPSLMKYGGVERTGWRLAQLLANVGCDVIPIASSDSQFSRNVSTRGLWLRQSWCCPDRRSVVFAEDEPCLLADHSRHVVSLLNSERPDVIIFLEPSYELLSAVAQGAPDMLSRSVVSLRNGPSGYTKAIPLFKQLKQLKLLALTEVQRRAFGDLADRIEVVAEGIVVDAVPFSPDPVATRIRLLEQGMGNLVNLTPDRPLIGQIDYFHPNKGMLLSLAMYEAAGLAETHNLILAGGMGWQLPSRNESIVPADGIRYLAAIHEFVEANGLTDRVQVLGALTGAQTSRLLGGIDIVVSPVRMDHGSLWPAPTGNQDPESYGKGRATANAAGTPVLMSDKYDLSCIPTDRYDLRFGDFTTGVARLRQLASRKITGGKRAEMRAFAEERDSFIPGFKRYVTIVGQYVARSRGAPFELSETAINHASKSLVTLEAAAAQYAVFT
jgi:glycosyltransferase involved in cell wall biosynthesis